MPSLTPPDIINPSCVSGFNHVSQSTGVKPFQADVYGGTRDKSGRAWKGPRRATAEEAAQDYCDYINGTGARPGKPVLKSAKHPKRPKRPRHPKIEQANKLRREAYAEMDQDPSGYVYAIGEVGYNQFVKIGESSDDPRYRAGELQEGNPRTLEVLGVLQCEDRKAKEAELHAKYISYNHNQEWFRLAPEILAEFPILPKGD